MNRKKGLMIFLLVASLLVIGNIFIKINNKSVQISNETAEIAQGSNNTKEKILEISDNYFIEQTNDVYLNLSDYIGKKVKMQGLIYSYEDNDGEKYYAVVRNTPGCCGNDGLAGLDIRFDGEYPKENTWVEVIGVIGEDTVYNDKIPAIKVTSLIETEQGETFVTN